MKEIPKVLITEHAEGRAEGVQELVEKAGAQGKVVRLYQEIKGLDSYEYDAVIVTGGPMGVYEIDKPEYRFLKKEADYLRLWVDYKSLSSSYSTSYSTRILATSCRSLANRLVSVFIFSGDIDQLVCIPTTARRI